jgi:uncharacterized protein YbjQ (UPF0145 family)
LKYPKIPQNIAVISVWQTGDNAVISVRYQTGDNAVISVRYQTGDNAVISVRYQTGDNAVISVRYQTASLFSGLETFSWGYERDMNSSMKESLGNTDRPTLYPPSSESY